MRNQACVAFLLAAAAISQGADTRASRRSWAADNGNGTYSNPLFYDEFSDPDMIRVGSDYYLTGTTMHTMPGLPYCTPAIW
jgi:beta-xylosidase